MTSLLIAPLNGRLKMYGRIAIAVFLFFACVASAQTYRFTFSNPEVGSRNAPYVLEYFSLVDCGPCRRFETTELAHLADDVESGRLRIIFRDLVPSEEMIPAATRLFCLQEFPSLLDKRIESKRAGKHLYDTYKALHGKGRARLEQCLEAVEPVDVMTFNTRIFEDHGFVGTPSFVFYGQKGSGRALQQWSGETSASVVRTQIAKFEQQKIVDAAVAISSAPAAIGAALAKSRKPL